MEQDRTDSFASPLDEVLDNLPQEDPPADLEQRCREALDAEAATTRPAHPRWHAPVRNVIAVAASLLLIVGTANLLMTTGGVRGMARGLKAYQIPASAPEMDRASEPRGDRVAEEREMSAETPPPPSAPMEPGVRAGRPGGAGAPADAFAPAGAERHMEPEPARDVVSAAGVEVREEIAQAEAVDERPTPMGGVVMGTPTVPTRRRAPTVEDPWRDFSGERQVITQKQMEIEVADVERAYDEARAIVEKHGGFVASDRVSISEGQRDSAHLTIRVPVGSFESAITDLRQLGEVVRLVGESVDVTEEYYTSGAETREMADREQALVEKYEAETNPVRKRQLKAQLDQLRAELRREKEILTNLAEQTHWPVLELVLTENTGPGGFLARMLGGSLTALAWVGATAIIWVPLVVLLTLFWRRIMPAAPRSEV